MATISIPLTADRALTVKYAKPLLADAFVESPYYNWDLGKNVDNSDVNFGREKYIAVGTTYSGKRVLIGYLKFVRPLTTPAFLNLYCRSSGDPARQPMRVHYLDNDEWGEDTITWNNQPQGNQTLLAQEYLYPDRWYKFDISKALELDKNGILTFVLEGSQWSSWTFPSKESEENVPFISTE
jgi:hypothetical protein